MTCHGSLPRTLAPSNEGAKFDVGDGVNPTKIRRCPHARRTYERGVTMNREIAQTIRITGSSFFPRGIKFGVWRVVVMAILSCSICSTLLAQDEDRPFLPGPVRVLSTVPAPPANQDLNPYGVAFVPPGFPAGGTIHPGDVL